MSTSLILFPGQGSQRVGMGKRAGESSPEAAAVFDLGTEVLGRDARELCWETPLEELTRTENAQPAIIIASLAGWAAAEVSGDGHAVFAGHSVGAIAAAAAAGFISFRTAIELAAARGALMADAPGDGAMLAIATSASASAEEQETYARELAIRYEVDVAAVNSPTQIVLSGARAQVRIAAEALGARTKELNVSHAFHSRMMSDVEPAWHELVANRIDFVEVLDRRYFGCISGAYASGSVDVREDLKSGLTRPVLWSRVMESTRDLETVTVFGPGGAIVRLLRPYRGDRTIIAAEETG